jgi:hypothetical protein
MDVFRRFQLMRAWRDWMRDPIDCSITTKSIERRRARKRLKDEDRRTGDEETASYTPRPEPPGT